MSITAKFIGDFSSFNKAVDDAELNLKKFETGAGDVEKALNKIGNSFSGRAIIQEATLTAKAVESIGGAAKLTEKELAKASATAKEAVAKMKALGIEVTPAIQKLADATGTLPPQLDKATGAANLLKGALGAVGIAFGVGAVVNFGKALLDDADALLKMHDRTGISIEGLQRLQIVGDGAGNTVEQMATAINKLQDNIAGGNKSALAALQKLHINLDDFRRLSPERQFIAISDAIREIQDPAEQVNISMDLFGKIGAEVLPSLKSGFDDVKDAAVGMSEATARALDDAGDHMAAWYRQLKGVVALALVEMSRLGNPGARAFEGLRQEAADAAKDLKETIGAIGKNNAKNNNLPKLRNADLGLPDEDDLRRLDREMDDVWKKINKGTEAARVEQEKWNDSFDELNAGGDTWRATVDGMSGDLSGLVQWYIRAGKSQEDVIRVLKISETEFKANQRAVTEDTQALKNLDATVAETARTWDEYFALRAEHGGTATDKQLADIDRWFSAEVAKIDYSTAAWTDHYAAIEALAGEKRASVLVDWQTISENSRDALQQTADKAKATYAEMAAHSEKFKYSAIKAAWDTAVGAQKAADQWGLAFGNALDFVDARVKESTDRAVAEFAREQAIISGKLSPYDTQSGGNERQQSYISPYSPLTATPNMPTFAGGVRNFRGGMAIVGERGPELVNLPRGADVLPHGVGGGGVTLHAGAVQINYPIMNDPGALDQIAQLVGNAILSRVTRGGTLA